LICEKWEGKQGMAAADNPEEFQSYLSCYHQYQDAHVMNKKMEFRIK